ncbi:MAG: YdcF family protein [Anaerolineae bacterium]
MRWKLRRSALAVRGIRHFLGKLGRWLIRVGALILCLAGVSFFLLCLAVDRFGRMDQTRPADVIVILGAQVLPGGEPGPNLRPRTEKAVRLYQEGWAPVIITTGGIAGDAFSAASVAGRTAVAMGVPEEAILIAGGSNNTREDVRRAISVMRERGWHSALVVSHPLHLLRGILLFWRAGVQAFPSPTSTDVQNIPLHWRAYYAAREAGLIILDVVYPEGEIGVWAYQLWYWLESTGVPQFIARLWRSIG